MYSIAEDSFVQYYILIVFMFKELKLEGSIRGAVNWRHNSYLHRRWNLLVTLSTTLINGLADELREASSIQEDVQWAQ